VTEDKCAHREPSTRSSIAIGREMLMVSGISASETKMAD